MGFVMQRVSAVTFRLLLEAMHKVNCTANGYMYLAATLFVKHKLDVQSAQTELST